MNARTLALAALVLLPAHSRADTMPAMPEELAARAALVITGQVLSHREEDQEQKDGSVIRTVTLTVKVETVEKGDAKPGDEIQASCWTVVRLPREGRLYDGGHFTIPGDGGRAKFYLGGGGGHWSVLFPNGVERLDSTPPLEYRLEKAAPPAASDTVWYFFLGGAVLLLLTALGIFLVARRREPKQK